MVDRKVLVEYCTLELDVTMTIGISVTDVISVRVVTAWEVVMMVMKVKTPAAPLLTTVDVALLVEYTTDDKVVPTKLGVTSVNVVTVLVASEDVSTVVSVEMPDTPLLTTVAVLSVVEYSTEDSVVTITITLVVVPATELASVELNVEVVEASEKVDE
jgi:hypothetical protein